MDRIDIESAAGGLTMPENLPREIQALGNIGAKPGNSADGKSGDSETAGSFPGLLAAQKPTSGSADSGGESAAGPNPGQLALNAVPVGTAPGNVLGGIVETELPTFLTSQVPGKNPPPAVLLASVLGQAKPEGELAGVNPAFLGGGVSTTPLAPGTDTKVGTGQPSQGEQVLLNLGALQATMTGEKSSQQGEGETTTDQPPGQQSTPAVTYSPAVVMPQGTQTRTDTVQMLPVEPAEQNLDPVLQSTTWQHVTLLGGGETTSREINITASGSQAQAEAGQVRGQVLTQILNQITQPDTVTNGQERITLQLDPPSLGKVEVQLQTQGDKLIITFHAASPEVAAALRERAEDLVEAIVSKGNRWTSVEIRQAREAKDGQYNQDNQDDPNDQDNRHTPNDPNAQHNPDGNPEPQSEAANDRQFVENRQRRDTPSSGV
ncbi:MAG: flagellar hook-length control protein FliK [bacterium]